MTQYFGIINIALYVLAFGGGCAFYRYWLKRDPAKLEAWAQAIKAKAAEVEAKAKKTEG